MHSVNSHRMEKGLSDDLREYVIYAVENDVEMST